MLSQECVVFNKKIRLWALKWIVCKVLLAMMFTLNGIWVGKEPKNARLTPWKYSLTTEQLVLNVNVKLNKYQSEHDLRGRMNR